MAYRWSGPIARYDSMTGDRRVLGAGKLTSRTLPLPLRYSPSGNTHRDAVDVGAIQSMDLSQDPIQASGVFLPESIEPMVKVAVHKAALGIATPSIDMEPGTLEYEIGTGDDGRETMNITKGHITATTLVSIPALGDQHLAIAGDDSYESPFDFSVVIASAASRMGWTIEEIPDEEAEALVAAACAPSTVDIDVQVTGLIAGGGPLAPPRSAFEDPKLTEPTPLTITPDGRVYGHLALWGVCHTGFDGKCIMVPHSKLDYAKFHQGTVVTSEGNHIRVGKITLGTGHASPGLSLKPAVAHYDNTGYQVAVIRSGEDEHGVWFSGSLLAGVTPAKRAELYRSPLSGDWRRDRSVNNLELIAALAVNSPGFPVFEMEGGESMSLVAAGMVVEQPKEDEGQEERKANLAALLAADAVRAQNKRAAALAALGEGAQ